MVLDQGLDVPCEPLMQLYSTCWKAAPVVAPALKRLKKAKKEAPSVEKPKVGKTHLKDMIILPRMVGSVVGV